VKICSRSKSAYARRAGVVWGNERLTYDELTVPPIACLRLKEAVSVRVTSGDHDGEVARAVLPFGSDKAGGASCRSTRNIQGPDSTHARDARPAVVMTHAELLGEVVRVGRPRMMSTDDPLLQGAPENTPRLCGGDTD